MIFKNFIVYPRYPENLQKLYELAYNLWCTWNYDALNLFYRIDNNLFRKVNHNPVLLLHSLGKGRIAELSNDSGFLFELEKVWERFQEYLRYRGTFCVGEESNFNQDNTIGYFSMEFGLHESVPIYAGGLGILAGDFLKGASDLALPVVGIGLIYKYGYFTQRINPEGNQEEIFIEFENYLTPIHESHDKNGEKIYLNVTLLNRNVRVKVWHVEVGKTKLILLDTDIEDNPGDLRDITHELYVADREKRLQQELILGFGGLKALHIFGISPKVYHLNEGHSAFLIIGRLRELMLEQGLSFSEAKAVIRASTVFTTHTPVIAGNENFDTALVKKYLEKEIKALGLSFDDIAKEGFVEGNADIFWLPAFAMKYARYVNAVSRQHRDVSRRLWQSIFPERHTVEVPIDQVTNGVHSGWVSEHFTYIFNRYIGPDYVHFAQKEEMWEKILQVPNGEIWEAHRKNKQDMVNFIRRKLDEDLAARGYYQSKTVKLSRLLNPEYLTVVFARRFAHYKNPTLILADKDRLKRILTDSRKPVQLIFAGKAHPADWDSKNMIKGILLFARDWGVEDRVIFLENYDMNIARHLIWGADVWLNCPDREMEASGTSGMKAAMNGVLHFSSLEGWWAEGFTPKSGWAITTGQYYSRSDLRELAEATQIYELLEEEITELFFDRNDAGVPERWVNIMKESIYSVCCGFNMNRVLCSYLNKFYIPSIKESERISKSNYQLLKTASAEESAVMKYWETVKFVQGSTSVDKKDYVVEGEQIEAQCSLRLGQAPPELFRVELFYMFHEHVDYKIIPMQLVRREDGLGYYKCSFEVEGYGLQNINFRIRPANDIVADTHGELIKWKI